MIYLIEQLSVWLLLTILFAGLAGWGFAANRAAPARASLRETRERLMRDLAQLAAGERLNDDAPTEAVDTLARVRESRIAELERALETARARSDEAVAEAAELRRALDANRTDSDELTRLRALAETRETTREDDTIETAVIEEPPSEDVALQTWRLRYFEQRVQYLEGLARAPAPAVAAPDPEPEPPLAEWRAREAEARAAYLEQALRAQNAPQVAAAAEEEAPPFAANADVDMLVRWRLLYLERRVAHLQAEGRQEQPEAAPEYEPAPDPDRWKWRARYLEARIRHLEQRAPVQAIAEPPKPQPAADIPAPKPVAATARKGIKPPVLPSARSGAPDDLTLIEGISLLQKTTLNALGVFHFDQIAAWTPENVAWVDQYFRLRGRIDEEDWVEQAAELAEFGPAAARRALLSEDA